MVVTSGTMRKNGIKSVIIPAAAAPVAASIVDAPPTTTGRTSKVNAKRRARERRSKTTNEPTIEIKNEKETENGVSKLSHLTKSKMLLAISENKRPYSLFRKYWPPAIIAVAAMLSIIYFTVTHNYEMKN